MFSYRKFGTRNDGKDSLAYTLTNTKGASVTIIELGAIIQNISVPDRDGNLTKVAIGFDTIEDYVRERGCFGALIGPFANRIAKGQYTLNGIQHQLEINNGENSLHSGTDNWNFKFFTLVDHTEDSVTLRLVSDGRKNGFTATIDFTVRYEWTEDSELKITYSAVSDEDTLYNPTNHSYFNLNGIGNGDIYNHEIRVYSDKFVRVNSACIPTDGVIPVTPMMDLRTWTKLGDRFARETESEDLVAGQGYDHCYVLSGDVQVGANLASELYSDKTGIRMMTYTDMPGIQLYTGNCMHHDRRTGVCLETEFYPDSPNHSDWAQPILKKGIATTLHTSYRFDAPEKCVILDGYTSNPGDLSWDGIRRHVLVTEYDRTPKELVIERSRDAKYIIMNKIKLGADVLSKLPKLKYIGLFSTGYNTVDLDYCKEHGIALCNVPGYSTEDVAQMTFALILELMLHVAEHSRQVHEGSWEHAKDFCFWSYPLIELSGKTLGIIGYGAIGQRVAEIALAFHMNVLVYSRTPRPVPNGAKFVTLDEIFTNSDIVSLHAPQNKESTHIVCERTLSMMKKTAFIVNTARGGLIDEDALVKYLNSGLIAGAGVDVLSEEPPRSDSPMLTAKNLIITPHISWAAWDARKRLLGVVEDNIVSYQKGDTLNRIV